MTYVMLVLFIYLAIGLLVAFWVLRSNIKAGVDLKDVGYGQVVGKTALAVIVWPVVVYFRFTEEEEILVPKEDSLP